MPKPFDKSRAPADPPPVPSYSATIFPIPETPPIVPALGARPLRAPAEAPRPGFLDHPPAPGLTPADSGEEIPANLRAQLEDLEKWAVANQEDARNDAIRFWSLKIPAIIASVSAGIFAFYEWKVVPLIVGAIGSACVVIDGLNPGGALRNAHYKTFYRVRDLEHRMITMWRVEAYTATTPMQQKALVSKIIKDSEKTRQEISDELEKAETALDKK